MYCLQLDTFCSHAGLTDLLLLQVTAICNASCSTSQCVSISPSAALPQSLSCDQGGQGWSAFLEEFSKRVDFTGISGDIYYLVTFIIHLSKNWGLKPHQDTHYRCHYFRDKCIKQMSKSNPEISLSQGTMPSSLHTTKLETCNLFCCSSLFHLSHIYKRSKKFIPTNSPSAQVLHKPVGSPRSCKGN